MRSRSESVFRAIFGVELVSACFNGWRDKEGLDEAKPGSDCWLSLQTLLNPQNKEVTEHTSHLPSYKFFLSSDLLKRDTRSMVKGNGKAFSL